MKKKKVFSRIYTRRRAARQKKEPNFLARVKGLDIRTQTHFTRAHILPQEGVAFLFYKRILPTQKG